MIPMEKPTFLTEEGQPKESEQLTREQISLRIGATSAILGAVLSVAAIAGFGNLTNDSTVETVLQYLATRPTWYWPVVHLGFIFGSLLWVGAFIALARSLTRGAGWLLGWSGVAAIIIGATLHIVDSSIRGFGLAALAHEWADSPPMEQTSMLQDSYMLLQVLGGMWAIELCLYYGLPFVLSSLAVAQSFRYPTWLGWVGVTGGAGSLVAGILMFIGSSFFPSWFYIVFALVVSVWMAAIGVMMSRHIGGKH
jgi:hypothetical protein